jgi:hypothetical protein
MRFTALLLASLWTLGASLAVPCPKSLRLYFAANLAYTAGTQPFLFWFGETSLAYALAYYIGSTIHFAAALNVARSELARRWHLALGALVALAVVWRAYAGMPWPIHHYQWFYMAEGGALALAGTALAFSAAWNKRAGIMLTLSFLWLALAWFRLGFAVSLTSETWLKLNEVLPTIFVCAALGWCGVKLLEAKKVTI